MTSPVDHIRRTVLPNGLRIVTDAQPERATVSVAVWVGVGARDEPEELAGVSHFLEHLLFKGTEHRDAREVAMAIDGVGAEMNAFTASEHTAFYTGVPVSDTHVAVDILLDVVEAPTLSEREVYAERHVILEELAAAQEDPDDVASVMLFHALYPDHPLGRETLGTFESIGGLSRDGVHDFFKRWYQPANLVVTAAGAIDHDLLAEEVAIRFGDRETGESPVRHAPCDAVDPFVFTPASVELAHLAVGWRAPSVESEDRYPLAVLNHLFGAGPSSFLFQEIREARGLTYSVSSEVSQHIGTSALTVHCGTAPSQAVQLLDLIEEITHRLARRGIDREALARAKGAMRGGMVMGFESPAARMTRLGVGETMRGAVVPVAEHLERIEAVTIDDVRRVADGIFSGPRALSVVGSPDVAALREDMAPL
jgi:predicted Zn-dependent peptidase